MAKGKGQVVPLGAGQVVKMTPSRFATLKLQNDETNESVMMFEEVAPAGTVTNLTLHHNSDEVAYVLSGEITFEIGERVTVMGPGACAFIPRGVPHAWKSTGTEAARVLFIYTPGRAGRVFEEMLGRTAVPLSDAARAEVLERASTEIVGPPPF